MTAIPEQFCVSYNQTAVLPFSQETPTPEEKRNRPSLLFPKFSLCDGLPNLTDGWRRLNGCTLVGDRRLQASACGLQPILAPVPTLPRGLFSQDWIKRPPLLRGPLGPTFADSAEKLQTLH